MYLSAAQTTSQAETLAGSYRRAAPFPHVAIEGAVTQVADLAAAFPGPDWSGWQRYGDEYQRAKMICSEAASFPPPLRDLLAELHDPPFLAFLEAVTGTPGLIPDPYLEGGGLHCSGPGGILAPHTDFHLYRRLGLYRRLNVLIYLNESWDPSWGGCLGLYVPSDEAPAVTIPPGPGTCVIFQTDDRSPHGFTEPVAAGHWRRSLALYYYTASEAPHYSGDTNTYWRQSPERGAGRRARQMLYNGLIFGSRSLAFLAHRADPKLAPRSRR